MRALRFSSFGGPEVLGVEDVPEPAAGPGEVLVEVHAGGVNFADTERRRGLYLANEPLPETLGFEGAGVVVALGPGVAAHWLGRRVAFTTPRAHAERCVVAMAKLIELPAELDFERGAAFPVQALTAWHVLHTLGRVTPEDTVLVHSAAGGVGQLLVQLAREAGAQVIGTVSREAKAPLVAALGAHHVLTRDAGFDAALARVAPRGASLVLEAVGAGLDVLSTLAALGRWVTYGTAAGAPAPLDLEKLYEKSASVSAFWLRTRLPADVEERARREVLARLVGGRLRQELHVAPLEEAARVHRRLEAGLTTGKWVLRVR
ncbi:MAG: quinone oxidoreductase family protein [Myxococcota bacterium]